MISGEIMTDPKKPVKVTVLPAGHPLLRNLNMGQQQVLIRQQQQQHVVVQQAQPKLAVHQEQPTVYQLRQPGQQQFIIRQQTTTSQIRPQQVTIRASGLHHQTNITNVAAATANQQPLFVKSSSIPHAPSCDGQIKLTPQQLAAITGGAVNSSQQQFVIKKQAIAVRKQAQTQQIMMKSSHNQSLVVNNTGNSNSILVAGSVSPIKSGVVTGRGTTKSFTTVAGSVQPVVTYIKGKTNVSPAKSNDNNLVKTGPHIITVKPELLNKNTLVPIPKSQMSRPSLVSPVKLSSHPSSIILSNSGNVVKLSSGQLSSLKMSAAVSRPMLSLPTVPIPPHTQTIRTQSPVSSCQLLRGLSPVTSVPVSLRSLAPVTASSQVSPRLRQVVVRPGASSLARTAGASLQSPPRTIQPKLTSPSSSAAPAVVEGLQLVTADGRLVTAEGLHLLSPNGTVVEAKSLLKTLSSPSSSPQKSPLKLPPPDFDAAHLISSIQTPVPMSAKNPASLIISGPPSSIFSASLKSPVSLLSSDSPPPMQIVPHIQLPSTPLNDAKPKEVFLRSKDPSKDILLTRAVSPSQILPPPPSVVPRILNNPTNISDLLPTQPLLPSEIKSCLRPVKSKSFDSKPSSSNLQKPLKPKFKSKKESHRAKVQKLEARLNCQPILSIINKKLSNNNELFLNESNVEKEYLNCVEKESRGEELTKSMAFVEEKYYDIHNLCRYVDFTNFTSEDETEGCLNEALEETYLNEIMKEHVKRKSRKKFLLSAENDFDTCLNVKKFLKGRGRGRPSKVLRDQGTGEDQDKHRRHRLWISIMKKEVGKAGKARSCSVKEKLANAKRLAAACMRVQRLRAMESQRAMKEAFWRAKRLTREMQSVWRRQEREERQKNKAKEKAAMEQRKHDVELLEAKRQQRKLNFLITQTELYAHFMAGKLSEKIKDKSGEAEERILSQLDSDLADERLRDLDNYDAEATKAAARQTAKVAAKKTEYIALNFDQRCGSDTLLTMSEAAETAGDRPQPEIFQVANRKISFHFTFNSIYFIYTIKSCKLTKHALSSQGTLKTYQLKGMNWLCSLYDQGINGILADEMGLGKTVQALSFLAYVAETYGVWGPFLVITPASTLHNWQQEIARFVPDFKCVPYWGSPQERKVLRGFWNPENLHTKKSSFHIVVTSYQIVVTDYKYFTRQTWMYMVLDEAQAIKSASSQRWKMLLDFKCRGRLLLSGTPIQNTMAELWSLLHFVMPALFDSHDEFKEWFSKDIEGHVEGTKAKVDEKQMSRLHLILKPFMLRRIKKDVENELTEKVEVLVYCPLTIRQKLLYTGLKQNIRMEELLAGLGLGSGTANSSMGVSNLMNLVMQFRKVCNHPELFERREPKSPFMFNLPPPLLPRLPFLDPATSIAHSLKFSIFRSDYVHNCQKKTKRSSAYLEVSASPFSFLFFIDMSPEELERQHVSIYHQYMLAARTAQRFHNRRFVDSSQEDNGKISLLMHPVTLPESMVFVSTSSNVLHHADIRIRSCPETISHRLIRSKTQMISEDDLSFCPEIPHFPREDRVETCVPITCPSFLMTLTSTRAASLPFQPLVSSRAVEYTHQDHLQVRIDSRTSGRSLLQHGSRVYDDQQNLSYHYSSLQSGGLTAARPSLGWSGNKKISLKFL